MTEQQTTIPPPSNLSEIFARMNMGELPAMSYNVQKLLSLTNSNYSTCTDLANVILKDYSLTNKVLQIVNSAYYSLGQPCNSISKAVTILGFDAIRDMATVISLFEDFIKSGVDKECISKLLACSFLSGTLARKLVDKKTINVPPEEAFICALFYHLGKSIVCIYLPDKYREIETNIDYGMSQNEACRAVLTGLTFQEIGAEMAKFWNLSERIVSAMEEEPKTPKNRYDAEGYLQNLASFANLFVNALCDGSSLGSVFHKYGRRLKVNVEEAIPLLSHCIGVSEAVSETIRYGLSALKIWTKLRNLEINAKSGFLNSASPEEQVMRTRLGLNDDDKLAVLAEVVDDLPISTDKSVPDYIRDMDQIVMGPFDLNDFYRMLLEALYRGIGFDRVILAILRESPAKPPSVSCFGLGDIEPEGLKKFERVLAQPSASALANSMKLGRDMMIPANKANAFPADLLSLVKDRTVYLFPLVIDNNGVGMIYLDRKAGRPLLDQDMTASARLLRDCAVKALCNKMKNGR